MCITDHMSTNLFHSPPYTLPLPFFSISPITHSHILLAAFWLHVCCNQTTLHSHSVPNSCLPAETHHIPFPATKNTKNTKKLPSFVLPFSPLSTSRITFLPSRKLFLRYSFSLGANFHHHYTTVSPRFQLHSWEFVKSSRIRKLGEEEAWR